MNGFFRLALAGVLLALSADGSAAADSQAEKDKIAQCGRDICGIIVSKKPNGPDVTCDLVKTWEKEEIQKGADYKHVSWGLGQARCTAKLTIKRADVVAALTSREYTLKIGKQPVSCEIGADKYTIGATVAPELKFTDGVAASGTVQMDDIEGAALIKGVVWTAAALERNFGLFESDLIREVNCFVHTECPKLLNSNQPQKAGTHK